jgi:hypothetical protein
MTSQDLRQDHTEDLESHLHPHRKIREYPSFEAREREFSAPLTLCRASKRERWYGAGGEEMAPSLLTSTDGAYHATVERSEQANDLSRRTI